MNSNFLKNKSFIVIDDEQATVDIVKEVLNRNGAKATGITNPEQGFGMMAKEKFDAIILDRYMPPIDGHEILEQLKANSSTKEIPVVMLTGESKATEIKKSIELGAAGYVIKPFTPKNFMHQLERIFGPEKA